MSRASLEAGAGEPRAPRWALALALAVLVGLGVVTSARWGHSALDPKNDACLYVLTARSLAAGEGYLFLGEPFTLRPPGFSFLIAPFVGTEGVDFSAVLGLVRWSGVACAALVMLFLQRRLGVVLATAVAATLLVNRGFQTLSNQVMSDVPGLAWMFASLWAERFTRGRPAASAALGLFIGLGSLVRSAVLFAAPAIVVARVLAWLVPSARALGERERPRWASGLLLLGGCALVLAPWSLRNAAETSSTAADQTFMHSYSTAMWHVDAGDPASPRVGPAELWERAQVRAGELLTGLGSRLGHSEANGVDVALGVLFTLAVALVLLRRRGSAEILFFGYGAVMLVYFGFRVRLCLPLYAIGLAALADVLNTAWRWPGLARLGQQGAGALAVVCVLGLGVLDAGPPPERAEVERGAQGTRAVAEWIGANVPARETLAATQGFELGVYLPDRPVYSVQRAFRRDGPAGLQRVLTRHDVRVCAIDRRDVLARPIALALRGATPLVELGDWVVLRLARGE